LVEHTAAKPFVPEEPRPLAPGETVAVRVHAGSEQRLRCPYCHSTIAREHERWVACASCHAIHHRACWVEGRACATCRHAHSKPRILSRRAHLAIAFALLAPLCAFGAWHTYEAHDAIRVSFDKRELRRADFRAQLWAVDPSRGKKTNAPELDVAIERAADFAPAWAARGRARTDAKDYVGAEFDFTQAIALEPWNNLSYVSRGYARAMRGVPELARADFDRALELDPRSFWAWSNRGWLRALQDDLDGARLDLNRALELDATHAFTWAERAKVRERSQDFAGAVADYARAIALEPKNAETRLARAKILVEQAKPGAALDDLFVATDLKPNDASVWALRGRAHTAFGAQTTLKAVKTNELDLAVASLTRAIELEPENPSHRVDRAAAFRLKNDPDKGKADLRHAVADLKRALELRGADLMSQKFDDARVNEPNGDLEAAYQEYSKILREMSSR